MASVAFTGNTSWYYLYLGGIIGCVKASSNRATVRNCVNYGSVTYSGTADYSYIGGIVGRSDGWLLNKAFIQNCLNYGTIKCNGTTENKLYIGGILGYSSGITNLDNCVSDGKIIDKQYNCYIGSVVGYEISSTTISHCYWSSDVGYKACGYESPTIIESTSFNSTTFELRKTISVGSYTGNSLVLALNAAAEHYILRDYCHWALNNGSKKISFAVNGTKRGFTLNSQLILLPGLANKGKVMFDGWYTDNSYTDSH